MKKLMKLTQIMLVLTLLGLFGVLAKQKSIADQISELEESIANEKEQNNLRHSTSKIFILSFKINHILITL